MKVLLLFFSTNYTNYTNSQMTADGWVSIKGVSEEHSVRKKVINFQSRRDDIIIAQNSYKDPGTPKG